MDIVDIIESRDVCLDAMLVAEGYCLCHVLGDATASTSNAILSEQNVQRINRQRLLGDTRDHQEAIRPEVVKVSLAGVHTASAEYSRALTAASLEHSRKQR